MQLRANAGSTRPAPRTIPLRTHSSQVLEGTYSDADVESFATEDGRARFFTKIWGKSNREPRAIHALNRGAEVSRSLIYHDLHSSLLSPRRELEMLKARAPLLGHAASVCASELSAAHDEANRIRKVCRESDLPLPEHLGRRALAEVSIYAALVLGDLMFITAAYQVFGLSDQSIGFLPFSALQVAASSTVVALLVLTRLVGRFSRQLGYLTQTSMSPEADTSEGSNRRGRSTTRLRSAMMAVSLAAAGVLAILVGLSSVRASYLAQLNVPSNFWEFFLIQTGIAVAGCATSYWTAHPLEREWRAATRHLQEARHRAQRSRTTYVDAVGRFNGLLRTLESITSQHHAWADATMFDAARKAEIYARRLQHAQPEPTDDTLLISDLPKPSSSPPTGSPSVHSEPDIGSHLQYLPMTVDAYLEHLTSPEAMKARAPVPQPQLFPILDLREFANGVDGVESANGSGPH